MGALSLNLLDQLSFYGAYHNNRWNQLIHFFFVPTIVWTICVWLSYTGAVLPASSLLPDSLKLDRIPAVPNGAFLLVAAYSIFYTSLDFIAGVTWTVFVGIPTWITATGFATTVPGAWQLAIPLQLLSWYMQIHPGHLIFEKRRPALLDNLVQAFVLAPLFVWFELLFLLGYRPKLQRELASRVRLDIAAWKVKAKQDHKQ